MEPEIEVREAVVISGYSQIHIYHLVKAGRVKARKVFVARAPGVLLLIDRESLVEYLRAQGRPVNGTANNS